MNAYMFIIVPVIFFILMSVVLTQTVNGNTVIQKQLNAVQCPMPEASGLWNNSGTFMYQNGTYNYPAVGNRMITLSCSPVHTLNGFDYYWGTQNVTIGGIHIQSGIPFAGMIFFIGDYISEGVYKIVALTTLGVQVIIPPANLDPNVSNLLFFAIYIPMYMMFIIGVFVTVSGAIKGVT